MNIVPWPTGAGVKRIEWQLDQPAQSNRADFTGARRVTQLPMAPRWSAKVELAPIIGEANALAWRGFLVGLRGLVNAFRLPATEGSQIAVDPSLTVDGDGQGGYALNLKTGTVGAQLRRGMMVSVSDLLLCTMADATVGGDGKVQLAVEPYLRVSPANNGPLAVKSPTCLVSLKGTSAGWSVDPGQLYGITFEVEEAF